VDRQQEANEAKKFFDTCHELLVKKAHDYAGDSDCFSNFHKISVSCDIEVEKILLMFISLKVARIVELLKKGKTMVGESIQDSLKDMANYSCILSLYVGSKSEGDK
jgi:hypothetical protein